jgi:hypothetical protein
MRVIRLTLLNIRWFSTLLRDRVIHDYVLQFRSLEVLLAWLLLSPVLGSVLLHWFEAICFTTGSVDAHSVEELVGLLANLKQVSRRRTARELKKRSQTYPSMSTILDS